MSDSRFLLLLSRKKSGQLTLPEQKELSLLLEQHPEYAFLADAVDDLFTEPFNHAPEVDEHCLESNWEVIHQKINSEQSLPESKNKSKLRYIVYAVAASIIVALLVYYPFVYNSHKMPKANPNFVSTKKGSKTNLELPDGTQVWLNGDSKITYDKSFGGSSRDVYLSGEAYFDVVHNDKLPFIVHTAEIDIKVLGTAFNVKAYATDKKTEATLIRGSIEVNFKKDGSRKILLKPNEKLTVERDLANSGQPEIQIAAIHKQENDSVATEAQWNKNKLAFDNEKLEDIARQLSRWYGIEVEVSGDALKEKRFTGNFEQESVQEVMDALKVTGEFNYNIEKNKITILP